MLFGVRKIPLQHVNGAEFRLKGPPAPWCDLTRPHAAPRLEVVRGRGF